MRDFLALAELDISIVTRVRGPEPGERWVGGVFFAKDTDTQTHAHRYRSDICVADCLTEDRVTAWLWATNDTNRVVKWGISLPWLVYLVSIAELISILRTTGNLAAMCSLREV